MRLRVPRPSSGGLFEDPPASSATATRREAPTPQKAKSLTNSSSNNGWWVETCTLPASMAKICVATISIFNINYGTD